MIKIGYLLICEDVAYNEDEDIHYIKNPLEAVILDKIPSRYNFYMLSSLFNVNEELEYIVEVEIINPNGESLSNLSTPIVFYSKAPKGKRSTGIITLNIHHKNFEFKDVGVHKLILKIREEKTGEVSLKEIDFPVLAKETTVIEDEKNE